MYRAQQGFLVTNESCALSYYNGMEGLGKDPGPDEIDGFDMRKSMTRDVASPQPFCTCPRLVAD